MSTTPKTYYLIDGSGYIFRAFHALPMMMRKSDGLPVNAVYGFTNMLIRLLADLDADHLAVIYDASERGFRNEIYPAYKAQRPPAPEELVPQFPLIRATSEAFNLPGIEVDGFEADDIIATYARMAREEGSRVVIVSSDKDMMQLVGDGVTMLDPIKNKPIDAAEVMEKFGVMPDRVVDVQSLAGDSVDNVPGVPGIGIKTAAQLITEYGDLDSLLARAGEIKQPKRRESLIEFAEQARISRQLVRLRTDAPVPVGLEGLVARPPNRQKLIGFLEEMEFRTTLARVEASFDKLGDTGGGEPDLSAPGKPEAIAQAYELVQDSAALQRWADAAVQAGVLAIDTETNSLDAEAAVLCGISLATAPGRACYIPLAHVGGDGDGLALGGDAPAQIAMDEVRRILGPVLVDPSVLKVGHNLKYDAHVLGRPHVGLPITPWDDTMLISYVLDGGAHGHGMDELSELHLQHRTIPYSAVCGTGKTAITFDKVPLDKALAYAAEDADITLRLHMLLKPRLVAERMATVYETIERPLVGVIADMEMAGIKVDRTTLSRLSGEFAQRMAALEAEIHVLALGAFNVGSPKQLGEVLFERLGLPGGKKSSKTGAYSTDSSVLELLAAQGHDIATKILEWRQLAKLKGTYTDALQAQINEQSQRVHTSFSLAATNTGRLSSNEPNLQNIPIRTEEGRKIRYAFVAEPGNRLISVDYSQIELRLVAQIADVSLLKQAFLDGTDIHAMTASQVFGVPLAEMTPDVRRKAKAINFGIIYGISGFGLAAQLGIPQGEAAAFIRAYLDRLPELKVWMDETKRIARERGWVETLFGRKCHMPGIKDPNPARRAFAERQAINAPIQGTAADIIKRAMARLPGALAAEGLQARMLLQVHDELLFEAPEAEARRTAEVAQRVMQGAAVLDVPLIAEAGIGLSWAEAH
ncbi:MULTISPECIES: DNA polymerase I [Inquilinus]|uniref:DNA polymerase I n=1 Tax=Inquilinus ginsengisoli TaxID=363840 RepID=A0ABU1JV90_9PROT|nr:DNA polymerase I [Inquilinus ginsengisoli]MDR6292536.1 DNA polymerase-1 [Inquilinus ginsengisoli]